MQFTNMIKIVQITDIHMPNNKEKFLYGVNPYNNLNKVVSAINLVDDIDCVLITGDIAHRGEYDAYMCVWELIKRIKPLVYWFQGNHDLSEVMLQIATKVNIKTDKSFIINETKIILLQTSVRDEDDLSKNKGRGFLFDYEMSFLRRELEEDNFKQCIIALHHPPVLSNSWTDRKILDNRDVFIALIANYPKVKLTLYGHQHFAQQTVMNNITFLTAPPVSYHYNPNGERYSLIDNRSGFAVIEMTESGKILHEFIYIS
jgi:Icc protein